MDNNKDYPSRVDRFEKKRKNTTMITFLSVFGGVLLVVLLALFLFNGDSNNAKQDKPADDSQLSEQQENDSTVSDGSSDGGNKQNSETTSDEQESESTKEEQNSENSSDKESQTEEKKQENTESSNNGTPEKQQVETPDDPNVKEAYTADWEPVGTTQEGPHTVMIEKGTKEWENMMEAVRLATGLNQDELVAWWVTSAGEQRVEATVSDRSETEIYRVYLQWVTDKGYRPERVEVLKENDQKYRSE